LKDVVPSPSPPRNHHKCLHDDEAAKGDRRNGDFFLCSSFCLCMYVVGMC